MQHDLTTDENVRRRAATFLLAEARSPADANAALLRHAGGGHK
jgi:hypothetical protein